MSAFKKQVFIQFYPDVWLNSPELRRLKPEVKGFYIDLICQLHFCFPYGYCSVINNKKAKRLQNQVNQRVNHVVIHEDNEEDNLWADLTLNFTLAKQLTAVENLEEELYKFLPYDKAQIVEYIKVLEDTRTISRSRTGIIYVRRMAKDFKRRVVAYLNGMKGGNPKFKKKKKSKNEGAAELSTELNTSNKGNLVEGVGYPSRSYSLPIVPPGKDKGDSKGENSPLNMENYTPPEFRLQVLYDKTWEQLNEDPPNGGLSGTIKGLTQEGFEKWKKFVDWVIENNYTELWRAKPFNPSDFQKVYYEKGFTEDWWKPTVEKILSTGLEPKHVLFYRIPEFMKHVARNIKGTAGNNMDAGPANFKEQEKW